MSDSTAVSLNHVGKMYKLFRSRGAHLWDSLGFGRVLPRSARQYKEFWALRGIDLELPKGHRIGVIGRNGAGKSTLLKLITGNLAPTEGRVKVNGAVRALIDAGGGFHPEFTGRENIRSALVYQGYDVSHIAAAEAEIADFTELGEFLDQPFKTYSLGMQARLTFATATAIKPDILVIDEMLGAGDGYFFAKSTERMRNLVHGGATVILVTHSLDQVMMFCEDAIWIDRGKIIEHGPSFDVCKAYEKHLKVLDDRRLRAKNLKFNSGAYESLQYEDYGDHLVVQVSATGRSGGAVDVSEVALLHDGHVEERLLVGDAQDAQTSLPSFVILDQGQWSGPIDGRDRRYRRLAPKTSKAVGYTINYLYAYFPNAEYAFDLTYRTVGDVSATVVVTRTGQLVAEVELDRSEAWTTVHVPVRNVPPAERSAAPRGVEISPLHTALNVQPELSDTPGGESTVPDGPAVTEDGALDVDRARIAEPAAVAAPSKPAISRWPGDGSMMIDEVHLLGPGSIDQTVYTVGDSMSLEMAFSARRAGSFHMIPVAVLFRRDGVLVSRFIGSPVDIQLEPGQDARAVLDLGPLNLGNGSYVFSVALYKSLDVAGIGPAETYDLIDRSYEFEVHGTPPLITGIFQHTGTWCVSPNGHRDTSAN